MTRVRKFAKFYPVGLSSIEPEGWLHRYLLNQRNGLTGHLEAAGYPFNTEGWASDHVPNLSGSRIWWDWWPYEQTGYWIDGMARCAYLLKDQFLIQKATKPIEYILEHQDDDGYLGPKFLKPNEPSRNRWPHAVFFRALMAHHSATGDERIPKAMEAHYTSNTNDHSQDRDVCNIEEILWTYDQTGNPALLKHALEAYQKFNIPDPKAVEIFTIKGPFRLKFKKKIKLTNDLHRDVTMEGMLRDEPGHEHGVTYNEICKQAAILYTYTGDEAYWKAVENAYAKLDQYHMLVDGVHSSAEHLQGMTPLDSHETCDIADYTWSLGYLLEASGKAEYADKIERACFNALPGAVTSDFKALQYFSCPNQVIADKHSNHNLFMRGKQWMSYRPNPGTECCPGNVHRVMPNYASRMWLADAEHGIVAALYAPSRITLPLGESQQTVTIVEQTSYPFSERIDFEIRCQSPVHFAFSLRIPGWTQQPSLMVNGTTINQHLEPGSFFTLEREFAPYDIVTLHLPMKIITRRWPGDGISIERGPLVYALRIEEDWQVDRDEKKSTPNFPAWNLYPTSDWNYALAIDEDRPEENIEIVYRPVSPEPWSLNNSPIELRVPARKVKDWKMIETNTVERQPGKMLLGLIPRYGASSPVRGHFRLTPDLPDSEHLPARLSDDTELVRLVPYGCTHLRLTIFPFAPVDKTTKNT